MEGPKHSFKSREESDSAARFVAWTGEWEQGTLWIMSRELMDCELAACEPYTFSFILIIAQLAILLLAEILPVSSYSLFMNSLHLWVFPLNLFTGRWTLAQEDLSVSARQALMGLEWTTAMSLRHRPWLQSMENLTAFASNLSLSVSLPRSAPR